MAGLTAAAYLSRNNFDVTVIEKNDRVGGLVNTFERKGFYFDSGPRAFVNSGIVKPILKDLGIQWEFLENKISIGIEDQLFKIRTMDDLREYQRALVHLYPENKEEIDNIISITSRISEYTRVLYEFDNPNFVDFRNDTKYIFKKLIPWTVKFLNALRKLNQYNMPMEVYLRSKTSNQSLIDILIQHFFRGMPAYFALGYFYVYLDYFYPRGGTASMANLLKEKFLEQGGKIILNRKIVEILPAESKVIDSEGSEYAYDYLIWAADLKTMYRVLNPAGLDAEIHRQIETKSQQMQSSKGAESVFIMYLAVNRPPSYFLQNGGEHMFYTPSSRGLGQTNWGERQRLINEFDHKSKDEVFAWLHKYLELNTYEISVPVLRDHTLAPEGQSGLMVSCLFDYEITNKVAKAGWYDEFKQTLENQVVRILSETIYKNFDKDILFKFSSTPLTIHDIAGSSDGAITGWSFETPIPVTYQLKDIPKSVLTPAPDILQAGQWAYAPAGVPIAMLTGWYASQKIIKQSKN